ncbi:MAG TPA: hypothetical protein DCZ91_20465 [Lachnospiraceae bacterium]|nr:hypothetical protein [Lachnospiraceae bacterium]
MRSHYKTQCFETLALLIEAHAQLQKFMDNKQFLSTLTLIEQCQQGAISIGTLIDRMEGEGTEAVSSLESYCEQIYHLYIDLQRGISVNSRKILKKLDRLITRIENAILYGIPTQREVVFLPYKASMWDSLESVWKAAEEDPDCMALVIPIPYYDKNPDGSLGEMHYEGALYPEDVPVVYYETYDFESRHPDMIFIHNPYDDGNIVTSVHPFFYSKNLKQYTDDLIYIPYFVLQEIDPADSKAVAGMEHFCTTAGVINANHVIVQSETMRQVYVNVLTKYTGEDKRVYWEKKILGLGSPKVDRVSRLKDSDFRLPEEWERRIRKADGTKKKVIFYNTSVTAMLQGGEAMLEKIRRNLQIFRENSGDVALLWRPHPLMEATLASMRPYLMEEYAGIVQEYKTAGWGIYDDSPDMDRAIAISDAYYGDHSSIVWLYQKTGKPIMIQTVDV